MPFSKGTKARVDAAGYLRGGTPNIQSVTPQHPMMEPGAQW